MALDFKTLHQTVNVFVRYATKRRISGAEFPILVASTNGLGCLGWAILRHSVDRTDMEGSGRDTQRRFRSGFRKTHDRTGP